MAYTSWSVVFGEQPSASKWNILGTNDASFNDGTGLPIQFKSTSTSAVATGTTTIPNDDTIPQITEGTEFMTLAITPRSASSILVIQITSMLSVSVANTYTGALFQDSTANALAAMQDRDNDGAVARPLSLIHRMVSGTTSSTTFRFRAGPASASTITFNGTAAASKYGAISKSSIFITEHTA